MTGRTAFISVLLLAAALAACGLSDKGKGPGAPDDLGSKGTLECVAFCHETHAVSGTSPVATWVGGFHAMSSTSLTPAQAASSGCSSCHDPRVNYRWQGDDAMETAFRGQERAYIFSPARAFIGCAACHGGASGHYLNGEGVTAPAATWTFSFAGTFDRYLHRPSFAYTPGNPVIPFTASPCACHAPDKHAGALTAGAAGRFTNQYPEWRGDGPRWTSRDGHSDSFVARTRQGRMTSTRGGTPCVVCHTVEGFVRFFARGDTAIAASQAWIDLMVTVTGDTSLTPPAQIPGSEAGPQVSCLSCHPSHESGNLLRAIGDAAGASTVARLCFACHNNDMPGLAAPTTVSRLASVPRSPQKELFLGVGGHEFAGFAYSGGVSAHSGTGHLPRACVTCHYRRVADAPVATYPKRVTSGHTFHARIDACTGSLCHAAGSPTLLFVDGEGAPDHAAYAFSNPGSYAFSTVKVADGADYDGDGHIETFKAEITGLLAPLKTALLARGAVWDNPGQVFDLGAMTAQDGTLRGAAWNYDFVATDRSFGIHNPLYARNLLAASLSVVRALP